MSFLELTEAAYSSTKILINVNNIVSVTPESRRGLGLKKCGAVLKLNTGSDDYIRVVEDYDNIKEIIERMML